jgi:hypothetical protein
VVRADGCCDQHRAPLPDVPAGAPVNGLAKMLVKLALYLVEHPDTIKTLVDAIHQAKQPKAQAEAL